MLFSSPVFLFLFLPAVLLLHTLAPRAAKNAVLLACSLLFYAWGEFNYSVLMAAVIAMNHMFGLAVERHRQHALAGWLLGVCMVANLGLLGYFKYAGFVVDSGNSVLGWLGFAPLPHPEIILPIGISFYTFQAMSYVIDVARGAVRAQRNPIDLALYVALFPQLIAGPIVRYVDVAAELRDRHVGWSGFASGVQRFCLGLAKKMLLANSLGGVADIAFGLPDGSLPMTTAWLGIVCYALQIYYDFSGYSDMAIGLGQMLGFQFLENFNYPYAARSLTDFWRRWHISLSTWFRDYLYIPLGGNRHGTLRTAANLLVVFLLCGLWHGASWTFVLWGLFHGVFLSAERCGLGRLLARLPSLFQHAYLLVAMLVGWVLFRANDLAHAWLYLQAMFGLNSTAADEFPAAMYLDSGLLIALAIGIAASVPTQYALTSLAIRAGQRSQRHAWLSGMAANSLAFGRVAMVVCTLLASAS
ncbi:MAG TPA: MBOAT family protein, partial [Pirellulales bacterium]|nr:MBOAT family protein [Pirellulales bacterium]